VLVGACSPGVNPCNLPLNAGPGGQGLNPDSFDAVVRVLLGGGR